MRVLIGAFGAIARMGIRGLLDEEGIDVVAEATASSAIVERLTEARPDVVFLDLDSEEALRTAAWIASAFPAITVIACSADSTAMRVYPPFHHGESYVCGLDRDALVRTLRG